MWILKKINFGANLVAARPAVQAVQTAPAGVCEKNLNAGT